ncbi:MAG TPA: heme o synthase [Candidatus Nanoarchaeia archaeon]|nr:heme o synthase [Candidatus Nanoarchaeia archaeon]
MMGTLNRYAELTKPKVTLLNLLVGATCFVLAAFPTINFTKLAIFLAAGYLACGGCGALNCVYDQDTDKMMQRTSKRAIPTGAIPRKAAAVFGTITTVAGVALSYLFFNALTALMMILGTVFYLGVYTILLKRRSSWNVVIGGLAGCFAALSGWTAIANTVTLTPLLVSSVDFLWTPGHLWGLATKKVQEYKKAKIPMLPVTVGLKKTAQVIFLFNLVTIASSLLFPLLGLAGLVYSVVAVSAGTWLIIESRKLLISPSEKGGFQVFLFSMPYLAFLMTGLLADKVFLIVKI